MQGSGMTEHPQRFLVIRLSSLGDIVHALPAVSALGETFPAAEIHWAVERRYAMLLEGNPFVHHLVEFNTLGWRGRLLSAVTLEEMVREISALRDVTYEAAIDFQGLWKSAGIARLSRAGRRVGFAEYWMREPGAAALYTDRVSPRGRKHVIEMNLALVEQLGARPGRWNFPLPRNPEDENHVEKQLASRGVQDFIILNPGGGWKAKCWDPENYAELIRRLEAGGSYQFLLTGSPGEEELIRRILAFAGPTRASYFPSTIGQFIALARRARLLVGGDTGPLHLAAAVGTPVVAIYGPTHPDRNGPFSPQDITLTNRGPINHTRRERNPSYLPGVSVEAVREAIEKRLARVHG